jgi:hypothetical protein
MARGTLKMEAGRPLSDSRSLDNPPEIEIVLSLPPKRYCPHVPTAKQLAFLLCPRTKSFFGGAAGPGKTEALLMGALQLVQRRRYSALLLRRTFRQLNQSNSIMKGASAAGEHRRGLEGRRQALHLSLGCDHHLWQSRFRG